MKLIKQKTLFFSEGNSDKVYEVDLCETQDLFVVNFRYGRRGTNLREGTKTIFPVSFEEAETTFNKLVANKEKKGYTEEQATITTKKEVVTENTIQRETIIKYLNQAIKGTYTRNWKVSKIIARVGVLNIKEATPLIAKFIKSSDEFEQYNAIAVLTHFNDTNYTKEVLSVFSKRTFKSIVGRIACSYILKHGNPLEKKVIKTAVSEYITKEKVKTLAIEYVNSKNKDPMLLYYAYILAYDDNNLQKIVYQVLSNIPLKVNTFKSIRYIYRTAHALNDISFFTLLTKRITISTPGYTSEHPYIDNSYNWVNAYEEKQKENPRIAFSGKTKNYFNKHSYKKIYEISTHNQDTYIAYAKELLCILNDEVDNANSFTDYGYEYNETTNKWEIQQRIYPKYHQFLALMYVLYGNSNRFLHQKNKWFYCEESNTTREETLADVWNQKPNEVLYILAHAQSEIAIDFSLRIIEDNPHFLEKITDELLTVLVTSKYSKVIDLIVTVLAQKYTNSQPEGTVLIALLTSKNSKAITLGLKWLQQYKKAYLTNKNTLVSLLTTNEVTVIDYLINLYKNEVAYNTSLTIENINPLFEESSTYEFGFLVQVNNLIGTTTFGSLLRFTPVQKIKTLSASSIVTNKLFAINLAKHNTTPAYTIFKETYSDYISSDEEVLRKAGIELLAHFPDNYLIENQQDLVRFCFSEYPEIRKAIQPTINKVIKLDNQFKKRLLKQLLVQITETENYEGLHQNCYEILTQFYGSKLEEIAPKEIIPLVLSKYEFAQKLGTPLFKNKVDLNKLTIDSLVNLAHSDVLAVREALHNYFNQDTARINYELETALRIFNTQWQDVIDWACIYFDKNIDAKNWTVDILLYVCDHVKEQVQAFGRSMVTKHFSKEKGLPLLLSLQEHPTKGMQFFVTNYLKEYAANNPTVILQLESYFKTTLFYINTNRATKTRVYGFLEKESIKNKEVAYMTVRILSAVLDTKTITDKHAIIDILLIISETYTDVEIPLLIQ